MEKRIELEKRGHPANEITELNLDNCRSTTIVGLTDEFTALESLSLINVGLTTLKGFPNLPNLKKLELSDNRISAGLHNLTTSLKLTHLNLSGNRIKDFVELLPLKDFKNLSVLDLFNNEATNTENYRKTIFDMIPSLKYLDGFDCDEAEALTDVDDDDDEVNGVTDSDGEADGEVGDEEVDDEEDESDYVEDNRSLEEIYNEDLEDDNSDYVEENDAEEDDEEEVSEDDESTEAPPQPAEAEAPSRGKKRKHDG